MKTINDIYEGILDDVDTSIKDMDNTISKIQVKNQGLWTKYYVYGIGYTNSSAIKRFLKLGKLKKFLKSTNRDVINDKYNHSYTGWDKEISASMLPYIQSIVSLVITTPCDNDIKYYNFDNFTKELRSNISKELNQLVTPPYKLDCYFRVAQYEYSSGIEVSILSSDLVLCQIQLECK